MKKQLFSLLWLCTLTAQMPPSSEDQQIAVKNYILAKVNGETISVLDVKKKMDLFLHKNYSHLEDSNQAKLQFYQTHWQDVLKELVDHELILADALEKQVPLSEGDIREEIGNRFGPSVMITLDKLGLTYDDAWKMVKDDMIVQRMTWWFVHSKAMNQITPQDIRQAFQAHVKQHPATTEWKYHVIALKGENVEKEAEKVYAMLKETDQSFETLSAEIQKIEPSAQISSEFNALDNQLSESHKVALAPLSSGQFSQPMLQKSKTDSKIVARIFYLKEKELHPAPKFEKIAQELKNELIQKAVAEESNQYLDKLRKSHTFQQDFAEDLNPFSLQ